jgi:heptosyltransferase-2
MPEKILIRGVNWIGDGVMTMPAIRAVKKAYPGATVHLLIKPYLLPLFENNPFIDSFILYDESFKGFSGKIRLSKILSKAKYSKAFLFQNAFEAAVIAFLSRIPERIGYSRDGRSLFLTSAISYDNDDRCLHHIDYYLNLLKAYGIEAHYSRPWIYLSLKERLSARERLSILKRPILGVNPGATFGSAKRWHPERFAEVAKWFIKDRGGSVLLFGGKAEVKVVEEIEYLIRRDSLWTLWSDSLLNLSGKTSLRELITLISECDLLLTNDSGPMHIGYAVGTPLISIFGSTDPDLTGYKDEGNIVMNSTIKCSPCFKRECKEKELRCMDEISSDDVYLKIKEVLSMKKAVFFDRDGTLCRDADYLKSWDDFEPFQDIDSLRELKARGFLLIGISNQSGISRKIVDESFVKEVNQFFIENYGFEQFYYCPHHPEEHCHCRKPEPGMILEARARYRIDLKSSYVVGDKDADILAAKAVGAKAILVKTGKQKDSEYADIVVNNLREATRIILHDQNS